MCIWIGRIFFGRSSHSNFCIQEIVYSIAGVANCSWTEKRIHAERDDEEHPFLHFLSRVSPDVQRREAKQAERNHRQIKTGASAPVFSLGKETETQYPVVFQKLPGKIDEIPPHWEVVEWRKLCYNRRQWIASVSHRKNDM